MVHPRYMDSTTVKVSVATRERLRALGGATDEATIVEALDALEADTHLHIHKENNVLFPAVLELEQHWEPAR